MADAIVYGASWCPDCRRAKKFLSDQRVPFEWHDLELEEHHPAGAFVFIGLDPNTGFLSGSVTLGERGFVATDPTLMTDVPGVYAAGDVRAGSTKQLASAVGEGAAVAIQIRGYLERLESAS